MRVLLLYSDDQSSTRQLNVDHAAGARCNCFWSSPLVLRVQRRDLDQRRAWLAQLATLKCASPVERLLRIHTVSSPHFSHADTRLRPIYKDGQLILSPKAYAEIACGFGSANRFFLFENSARSPLTEANELQAPDAGTVGEF